MENRTGEFSLLRLERNCILILHGWWFVGGHYATN